MNNLYLSPNNISIGVEEINFITSHLNISTNELEYKIANNEFSFFLHINTQTFRMNLSDPPHICYELYVLYKKDDMYYTQVFNKYKFPLEFKNLNDIQTYTPLFPFGYTGSISSIEYPVYKYCIKNSIYSSNQVKFIKSIFDKKLPSELIDIIINYLIKDTYNSDNHYFFLTDIQNLETDIYIQNYISVSDKKIILALKSN
jgi:hypothetical protein